MVSQINQKTTAYFPLNNINLLALLIDVHDNYR